MTFGMYSVKDELTGKFLQPIFIPTEVEALRMFKFMLNNDAIWKSNPAHFSLYKVGEFNDENGTHEVTPEMVQGGLSVVERNDND